MMEDMPNLSELASRLAAGEFSSRELTEHFLLRIQEHDGKLNSYITVCRENALAQADAADRLLRSGNGGALTGIPFACKDIFCTEGIRTTCASRMLEQFKPAFNATVVERLAAAGAVMLGKTNMDEFAMGSSNETSFYGPVRNPWDTERVPGGSSGGSAAAVAAGLAPVATGTDTGGSIRQPAALTGLTGVKPTYGRISRWGMVAFASSLDQAGVLARSAADTAPVLSAMAGLDPRDSTSLDQPVPDYGAALDVPPNGLKVGLPQEYFAEGLVPEARSAVNEAIEVLARAGVEFREISLAHTHLAVPAYYVVAPAEASSNLARYDGVRYGYRCADPVDLEDLYKRSRGQGFGPEVQRRLMVGTYVLSHGYYDAYYLQAQKVRRMISEDFRQAFGQVDLILAPTTQGSAFPLGAKVDDPVAMYLNDSYTIPANLAGLPALSMPVGLADGLPVGVQLIGNYFDEGRLLSAAHAYQQETDWHLRRPEGFGC